MNYILGGAYKTLLFALYLKNVLGEKITIVTSFNDLTKYCKAENIDYISFERIRSKVKQYYYLLRLKKILDDIIKKIDIGKEDKFFITCNMKGIDSFYLAKELSKNGEGYYKITDGTPEFYHHPWYKPIFFRGAIKNIALKLILGLDLVYYRGDVKSPCFGVDDDFFRKHGIKEYEPKRDVEDLIFEAVKKSKSKYKKFDNLIVGQGTLRNVVKFDSLKNFYRRLFKFKIEFAFKKHPESFKQKGQESLFELFKHCEEIPDYMPVELFYNNIRKNVLSMFSTALITASKFNHLKALSLLNLVEWDDEEYRKEWIERLSKASENKIIFPKSFKELEELLLKS